MEQIVHICIKENWEEALLLGTYHPQSLNWEGFIHFSRPDQVLEVANEFYSGMDNLILLWVDPKKLTGGLQWENVGHEIFPHLYGSLNLDAVTYINNFLPDADGIFRKLPINDTDY